MTTGAASSSRQPSPAGAGEAALDPLPILKGFASLRRLTGTYPAGHPMIGQKIRELEDAVRMHLRAGPSVRVDVIHGDVFLDGVSFGRDKQANAQMLQELADLGIDSIHIDEGVDGDELLRVAQFLWQLKERPRSGSMQAQLAEHNVRHVSVGRLVALDTRWRAHQWPEAPSGNLDPAYAESILRAQETFESVASGKALDTVTVRDLVQLLIHKVARSNAALGQILAVKQYENLTYCHSVNVAMLSLLLGTQLGLDEGFKAALVEAALLHDIGKTRIPLGILKKPGALDKRERKLMEAHTTFGAEILVQIDGLRPMTPIVALEHHRGVKGDGYPDVGQGVVPHAMSQIVSVADIYEAITGARSYQAPTLPEHACLVLARLAGEKLNTALVKAFVNAITFFPLGSLVRTNRDELGVVVRTTPGDPLHPVIAVVDASLEAPRGELNLSSRDPSGAYYRHIAETVVPQAPLDVTKFLAIAA